MMASSRSPLVALPLPVRCDVLSFCTAKDVGRVNATGAAGCELTTSPLGKFIGLQKLAPRILSSCYELLNDIRIDWSSIREFKEMSMSREERPNNFSLSLATTCLGLLKSRLRGSVRLRSLKFGLALDETENLHNAGSILADIIMGLGYLDELCIDMGRFGYTDEAVAHVFDAISSLSQLRFLSVCLADVSDSGILGSSTIEKLMDMLGGLTNLCCFRLHMYGSGLDFDHSVPGQDGAAKNLGTALARCVYLRLLDLNLAGSEYFVSFVRTALPKLIRLEELVLHLPFPDDEDDILDSYIGLLNVLHTIKKLRCLTFLFPYRMLAGPKRDDLINAIRSLQKLQELRELRLHAFSDIEEEDQDFAIHELSDLCSALGSFQTLPQIYLDLNEIKFKESSAQQQLQAILNAAFRDCDIHVDMHNFHDAQTGHLLYLYFIVNISLKSAANACRRTVKYARKATEF